MSKFINSGMLKEHSIVINQVELDEVLHKRVVVQGHKLSDLFMIVNSRRGATGDSGHEFELDIDTKYGKLKVFGTNDCPQIVLLHRKRFKYPTINKVSARAFNKIHNIDSHIRRIN